MNLSGAAGTLTPKHVTKRQDDAPQLPRIMTVSEQAVEFQNRNKALRAHNRHLESLLAQAESLIAHTFWNVTVHETHELFKVTVSVPPTVPPDDFSRASATRERLAHSDW